MGDLGGRGIVGPGGVRLRGEERIREERSGNERGVEKKRGDGLEDRRVPWRGVRRENKVQSVYLDFTKKKW